MRNRPGSLAAATSPWYRMEAAADASTADVYIYDVIDSWYGVAAEDFVKDLAALDVETIQLWVNSPGGSVYDGVAIMNALRRHPAKVVATVDGIAASAASFIIQAADEVVMGQGTELMIHDAWSFSYGNAEAMRETADNLDRLSETIASLYAERAGGDVAQWREFMLAETWYTAEEAVAAGLADRVEGATKKKEAAESRFDLSIFAHAGRGKAPAPVLASNLARRPGLSLANSRALSSITNMVDMASTRPPAEPVENPTPKKEGPDNMSDAVIKGLRERLGIPADANLDDAGILAAVDEALTEQADAVAAVPAAAGTVTMDAAQYADLQASAAEGRIARNEQLAMARAALVDSAVNDGRIPPARRQHWLDSLEADPGVADTLAGLAKGLIPLAPAGYTGGVDESSDEDTTYSKIFNTAKES